MICFSCAFDNQITDICFSCIAKLHGFRRFEQCVCARMRKKTTLMWWFAWLRDGKAGGAVWKRGMGSAGRAIPWPDPVKLAEGVGSGVAASRSRPPARGRSARPWQQAMAMHAGSGLRALWQENQREVARIRWRAHGGQGMRAAGHVPAGGVAGRRGEERRRSGPQRPPSGLQRPRFSRRHSRKLTT